MKLVPRYRVDPSRSRVWIDARSNVHPIHSTTDGLEGFVDLDIDDDAIGLPMAGQLSLPVSRLRSGNPFEDRELRRRIEARRHPTIDGTLRTAQPGDAPGAWLVSGELTFRGVTRTSAGTVTITVDGTDAIRLEGASRFNIRDFGMDPPKILMLRVEPHVDVRIEIHAARET